MTFTPDMMNGFFEGFGGLMILNHCRAIYRDKLVRGVSIISTVFFFAWGIFNVYFYKHLDQPYSWYAGIFMMCCNCVYVYLLVYYSKEEIIAQWNEFKTSLSFMKDVI